MAYAKPASRSLLRRKRPGAVGFAVVGAVAFFFVGAPARCARASNANERAISNLQIVKGRGFTTRSS